MPVRRHPPAAALRPGPLLLALALLAAGGCGRRADLPVLGEVPPFTLTDRTGTPFGSDALRGRVWIADFIFTSCPDICPALTTRMAQLGRTLAGSGGIQRVSISVDPARDDPAALARYAERHGAGADWHFLTGPRAEIARLLRDGFHVAFGDGGPPDQPITHSDRFVLVDRAMRIRGYYHGQIDEEMARLARDARTLAAEPPPAGEAPARD